MNIPDYILECKSLTPAEKLVLGKIRVLSVRSEGCNMKNRKIALQLGISERTVRRSIVSLHEKEIIDVIDGEERFLFYNEGKIKRQNVQKDGQNAAPELDKMSKKSGKMSSDSGILSRKSDILDTSYKEEPKEPKEEPKVKTTSQKSFSVLNTNHEELVKFLLKKYRTKLVNLLPKGTAEEIANEFAKYWVSQGRDFTNTKSQRDWVLKSLPKWAEFEKPKNEISEVKAIVKRIWRKELNDKELQFVTRKISNGVTEEDLIDVLAYAKTNIMSENRTNPYFVFGDNFKKYLEHSKEEAA